MVNERLMVDGIMITSTDSELPYPELLRQVTIHDSPLRQPTSTQFSLYRDGSVSVDLGGDVGAHTSASLGDLDILRFAIGLLETGNPKVPEGHPLAGKIHNF